MAEVSKAAKVGIMTIVLAGAAYGGYRFVSRDSGTAGGYRVWATIPDVTGVAQTSIGVRRHELVAAGLVIDSGLRRPAPSGSLAIVWRVA